MRIESHAVHVVHFGHGLNLIHQGFGVGLASALQVGIEEEIHGVKLVAFAAHVHGGGFARGGDGGEVGVDVVLPEANARENVRGHVQGVGRGGRDLGVTAGGGNAELGQLRLVVGVNQIMRDSGMVGFAGKQRFENGGGLFAVGESLVVVRLGGEQRERVEYRGFVIVGIATREPSSSRRNKPWRGRRDRVCRNCYRKREIAAMYAFSRGVAGFAGSDASFSASVVSPRPRLMTAASGSFQS